MCGIALDNLTVSGRRFVKDTLALGKYLDGDAQDDLPSACVWPDKAKYTDYKGTYDLHFMDVPKNDAHMDFARDCAAMDCIAVGIQRSLTYLSRPAHGDREKGRKAAALRFLGHFVGDAHQPLHFGNAEDWGGNLIKVKWFGKDTNLHAIWDAGIIDHADIKYPDSLKRIESADEPLGSTDVLQWMRESFRLARSHAYPGVDGKPIKTGDELGQAYYARSVPVVIGQLDKAGKRLAWLINQLAAGTLDTNILIK